MNDSFSSIRTEKCSRKLENELEFWSGGRGGGLHLILQNARRLSCFLPPLSLTLEVCILQGGVFPLPFPQVIAGDAARASPRWWWLVGLHVGNWCWKIGRCFRLLVVYWKIAASNHLFGPNLERYGVRMEWKMRPEFGIIWTRKWWFVGFGRVVKRKCQH